MKTLVLLTILIKMTLCEYDRRIITTLKYSKHNILVPTVVNGKPANKGQVPYFVSIKEPVGKVISGKTVWLSLCGGSIISNLKVLTAAHCFEGNNFYFAKHPGVLRLVAGNLKQKLVHSGITESKAQVQWRKIDKVLLHQRFVFPDNDIAMIFVDEPWIFSQYVNYAITATRATDYPSSCYSIGFGRTGGGINGKIPAVLLHAQIQVMSRWKCSSLWEMDMKPFICTESAFTDVDIGDSGGPLACQFTLDPAETLDRDLLVGVVSGKNYDKTTLFTRVSSFSDWIETGNTGFKLKKDGATTLSWWQMLPGLVSPGPEKLAKHGEGLYPDLGAQII